MITDDFILKKLKNIDLSYKIAIAPYGKMGKRIENILLKTNVVPDLIVDNNFIENEESKYIVKLRDVKNANQYMWILSTTNKIIFVIYKAELLEMGVNENQIIDPFEVSVDIAEIQKRGALLQNHYNKIVEKLKKKEGKLRFGAYVVFSSTFGADGLIRKMIEDSENWLVKIVVIPDVSRGEKHKIKAYKDTYESFEKLYGKDILIDGYDIETGEYLDRSNMFDVIYFANPYDLMVNPIHSVNYLTNKDILPIYINYGYDIGLNTTLMRLLSYELNIPWKIFTDTTYSLNDYNKYQPMHGENVILSGYAKMDKLYTYSNSYKHKNGRKKILISPHHTVDMKMLPLSNFLLYFDEIKNLPLKYDMVDFVFRPHPLLFTTLINHGYWTEEQVHNYIKDIQNNGMIYSKESDYLHLFFECDAIINDCGSFTVEWLFTGKPGCFMLNKDLKSYHVTQLMKKSLEKYNIAKNFKDVESFIEKIVNENFDDNVVEDWIKDNIMINYPDVSEKIIEELNSRLIQI